VNFIAGARERIIESPPVAPTDAPNPEARIRRERK